MSRPILIGTGFYAKANDHRDKLSFLNLWLKNTWPVSQRIVIIDNSDHGLPLCPEVQIIRISHNLGHACSPAIPIPRICGWTASWMIPAMMAFCEQADFIYKEQDCLAFGDWLPRVRVAGASMGRNTIMPCEQSLFYISQEKILDFIRSYLSIPANDFEVLPENKFVDMMTVPGLALHFHDLPGGRDRPNIDFKKPFYYQKITSLDMLKVHEHALL